MKSKSNSELSLRKDSAIKSDCESLKEKINIDLYSLYIESNRNVSVISNLPSDVKKIYRKENLYLIDPMLNNDKEGVFMTKNNRDPQEVEFNEKLGKCFNINNLYARSSIVGSMKVSFVLGSFCQEGSLYFNEVKDKAVIKFSKYMLKKYIHEISVEMEEVKLSPLILNPETIAGQLFNDSPIEKPNYGELSCLSLAKDGINVTEISKITGYKVSTVHSNLKNARLKLGAKKTIDAAIKAINLGWIA